LKGGKRVTGRHHHGGHFFAGGVGFKAQSDGFVGTQTGDFPYRAALRENSEPRSTRFRVPKPCNLKRQFPTNHRHARAGNLWGGGAERGTVGRPVQGGFRRPDLVTGGACKGGSSGKPHSLRRGGGRLQKKKTRLSFNTFYKREGGDNKRKRNGQNATRVTKPGY